MRILEYASKRDILSEQKRDAYAVCRYLNSTKLTQKGMNTIDGKYQQNLTFTRRKL